MTFIQLIGLLLLAALVFVIGRFSCSIIKFVKAFPIDAQRKNLKAQYANLIHELDKVIENTTTVNELNKALENIAYPPETLLVIMREENAADRDREFAFNSAIVNRLRPKIEGGKNESRTQVLNGSGYGHNNDQHFYIWEHKLKKYGYDFIEIRLERDVQHLLVAQAQKSASRDQYYLQSQNLKSTSNSPERIFDTGLWAFASAAFARRRISTTRSKSS
jgi:hypothetical protein